MTGILQGVKTVLNNTFFKKTNDVPATDHGNSTPCLTNSSGSSLPSRCRSSSYVRRYLGRVARSTGSNETGSYYDIFNDFPHRRFILVGDSGEKDPEVYAEIARRFPDRVACIFIHDVTTPMLLEQVQAKLETTIHGDNSTKTTTEGENGAEVKRDVPKQPEGFIQRIHTRLGDLKNQFHKDIHDGSETVGDLFDWVDNKTDTAQDELSIKVDELAQSSRKALLEFRQRIHEVFDGLKDWRLFMEAREMLSHEKIHSVFESQSVAQAEAQEPAVKADPLH
ncbi:hypothetical protein BDF22DRAFT_745557 [Syncephalis plumigaleata]|nr:hypothetical protein BDF22DRAFT_745557 [Syncephalis plumigaleata]